MISNKKFYFKNKFLDFRIKILFIDIKINLNGFLELIFSIFKIYNLISLRDLLKNNNYENILIIELNNFHSEIFPSWLFYLKKSLPQNKFYFLGPKNIHNLSPFDLLEKSQNANYSFYKMDSRLILTCYNLGLFRKFKKVIFNSEIYYFSLIDHYINLLEIFNKKANLKNSLFLSHNTLETLTIKNNFINPKKQLLILSPSISADNGIGYITPLFNENSFEINASIKNDFESSKIFVSCGNIKINSKDSVGLISALETTKNVNKVINIVGKASKEIINNKSFNYFEKPSYLELKKILEKSHFILFLLNQNVSYQYKFNNHSGSFPLALNFNLVPIIEESFAKFYLLNEKNAIIYKNGQLNKAIIESSSLSFEKYIELQNNLYKLKQEVCKESLKNLARSFE